MTTIFYLNGNKIAPTDYAGAYSHENATPFTIEEANTPHALHGWTQDGLSAGWTFFAGKSLSVTAWATSDAGAKTQVTCAGHGLANGDIVTFANTTNYDGVYVIEQKADDTFVIPKAYVADNGAQVGHAAGYLTNAIAASSGVYWLYGCVTVTPATNNDAFEFEFYLDTTEQTNTESQIKLGTATDYAVATAGGIVTYTAGQKIWVKVENKTGAGDLTIRNGQITTMRIK